MERDGGAQAAVFERGRVGTQISSWQMGIENTPLIAWEIQPAAPCYASIYWAGSKQPERLGALSWAELSFAVILWLEEETV